MQCGSTQKLGEERYGGVTERNGYTYPIIFVVRFYVSIETTKLWDSNYSDYQQYLFDRIRGLKENFLTPMGYRKISNLLNDEGLKTPRGTSFTNTKVHSIYKKGLIREERVNRKDIVLRSSTIIEPFKVLSNGILKSVHPPYVEEPKFPVPLKDD